MDTQPNCRSSNKGKNKCHKNIKKNVTKCVKFHKRVDVFKINDAWKLQMYQSDLKTEEEQVKQRLRQRNY